MGDPGPDAVPSAHGESTRDGAEATRALDDTWTGYRAPTASLTPELPTIPGYVVERHVGRGGMGDVFAARQITLDRPVALKVIRQEFANDPAYVDRFLREARAAARLHHPQVVTVFDAGYHQQQLYLAMEFIDGGDVCDHAQGKPVAEAQVVAWLRDAAAGVQAIHDAGLLHRDIKPENLLLGRDGRVRVADLGLARSEAGDDRMTATGQAVGTPAYMSPEQAKGDCDVDGRSDVYSLAATGFVLLTGRAPFVGATPWATVAMVMHDPAPDPRHFRADISSAVAMALLSGLAKQPELRPRSAQAFAEALIRPPAPGTSPTVDTVTVTGAVTGASESRLIHGLSARIRGFHRGMRWINAGSLRRRLVLLCGGMLVGMVVAWLIFIDSTPATRSSVSLDAATGDTSSASQSAATIPQKKGRSSAAFATTAEDGTTRVGSSSNIGSIFKDMKANIRGTLRDAVGGTVPEVQAAVSAALTDNGITITKNELQVGVATIEGTFGDNDALRVIVSPLDRDNVEISIQVGAIGDQSRQQTIREWIRATYRQ